MPRFRFTISYTNKTDDPPTKGKDIITPGIYTNATWEGLLLVSGHEPISRVAFIPSGESSVAVETADGWLEHEFVPVASATITAEMMD